MLRVTRLFQMNVQSAVTKTVMKVAHKTYLSYLLIHAVYTFALDWHCLNYWEIFHYLTNQPKGISIFQNDQKRIDTNKEGGAVFNDFDF